MQHLQALRLQAQRSRPERSAAMLALGILRKEKVLVPGQRAGTGRKKGMRRMGMKTLHLHVKKKWFDDIKAGRKPNEYRLVNPYWIARLFMAQEYDQINVYCGYPKAGDTERTLTFPWNGVGMLIDFVHAEFGAAPVSVFEIPLKKEGKA